MAAYDQIEIHSINRVSGVYRLRLNFDGSPKWISTGTKAKIPAQGCLMKLGTFQSSRVMEDLTNTLGNLKIELSDHPDLAYTDDAGDQTGNVIRESFEEAIQDGILVHALLARYSNDATPVFQEFVFAGSFDPREMTVAHRFKPKSGRRDETLSFEFTPAKRLDVTLDKIDWQQSDMQSDVRPFWLCVVCEPGADEPFFTGFFAPPFSTLSPTDMSTAIITGGLGVTPQEYTHDLAYGSNPLSSNGTIDPHFKDNAGIAPFPLGNWAIKLSTAVDKLFTACSIQWDGTFPDPSLLHFRDAQFNQLLKLYVDEGELNVENDVVLNWNYAFGFNPYQNTTFKAPATFDVSLACRDFLKAIAAQIKSRIDIYDYTSEGLPIARFVAFGQTSGVFPDLEELTESSEDALITDKDGVSVTRRGFSGAVVAPANAANPVAIEIPFAPYAMGYEVSPPYDKTRLTPNPGLDFTDQWKCGFRNSLSDNAGVETTYPLNPDGWVLGSHLFHYSPVAGISLFPSSHDTAPGSVVGGLDPAYAQGWNGYYPVHAIYEKDRGELSNEEIQDRQKNFLISYALYFGKYLRGQRRQVQVQFAGCVAPTWKDIATGQTYNFKPLDSDVQYEAIDIERDIDEDIITVKFEEVSPNDLPITYKIVGDQKSSGTLGGQPGTNPTVDYDNSDNLIKHPKTDDRDYIVLGQDSIGGGVVANVAQTKNLWQYLDSLLNVLSGISSIGTFFSKIKNAFRLYPYGAGAGDTGELQFMELAANGTDYVGFKAPDNIAAPVVWVLPNADGLSGQLLGTDALGNLGWYDAADANDVVTNPNAAGQNLIIATNNLAEGLGIQGKVGSSADTFYLKTSGGIKSFYLDSFGLLYVHNQLNFAGIGGSTQIGLDNGVSYDVGTLGFLLTSGGGAGYLSWTNPATLGVQFWTESRNVAAPNNVINTTAWTPNGGTASNDAAIVPKGSLGGILAAIPDSTATGGNKRGHNAVDLQTARSNATQVASGDNSVISGGQQNTASNLHATVGGGLTNIASGIRSTVPGGDSNTASGTDSFAVGVSTTASNGATVALGYASKADKFGQLALAAGNFASLGDAQASNMVAKAPTTDAAANVELLLNFTHITLSDNTAWTFSILVIGKQAASTNYASYHVEGSVVRGVGAGTTVVNGVATVTINDTIGCAAVASVLADVVNGGIKIVVTGKAATSINWVARLDTVEVTLV